ncbi:hypothetical protein R3P38DRAFT_3164654 [Favolaschia claudopus]|uniref:F-box domain-containing protein n=1 Tax=Favolaschia claudopus TaxID=2862362 RepID=A0AAW0EDC7_9AGAR
MDSANQNALTDTVNLSGSSLRARLAGIDAEIAALEARLAHLETAREQVAGALDSIVYPILSIPVEITSLIFACLLEELVFDEEGSWTVDFNDMKRKGPLFLAQICRAWREIVFNTSSMWSHVRVASDSSTKPLPAMALSGPIFFGHARNLQAEPWFMIATPHSQRWRSLSCFLDYHVRSVVDRIQGRTPLLHELKLESARVFSTRFPITAFSIAPELRSKVGFRSLPPICIALPWGQLTHLTLYRQTVTECIDILHQTPLLQVLSVKLDPPFPGDLSVPVTLSLLYKLELVGGLGWTQDFYSYVTLQPRLTDLRIAVYDGIDGLLSFLTQSRCTVEKLSLEMSDANGICVVLPFFDQLRHLTFPFAGLWWDDLAHLFVLIATDAITIPYEAMVQMLYARRFDRGSKPKLASFRIIRSVPEADDPDDPDPRFRADRVPDAAILDQLQVLIADGLELRIHSWHMTEPPFSTKTLSSYGRA